MGQSYTAKCKKCGEEFECCEGDSSMARLIKCDMCGKDCWCRNPLRKGPAIEMLDLSEKPPAQCECGGKFILGAPSRCPKCRSTEIGVALGYGVTMYD